MAAYIARRLLLMIPTILGIMLISFAIVQFAPGGPIERILAQLQGTDPGAMSRVSGGGGDLGAAAPRAPGPSGSAPSTYRGAQGLDPAFIKRLEEQFGFDRPAHERFLKMIWDYARFDFGTSFFRDVSVLQLIGEKLPVSITLGLWMTLLSYAISIPLGIRKAVREGSAFDVWTSGIVIVGYAIPGFLFAVLLIVLFAGGSFWQLFPLKGLLSEGVRGSACLPVVWAGFAAGFPLRLHEGFDAAYCLRTVAPDYLWHIALPITAMALGAFATSTLLTKNSFLDEIRKQYVLTARMKGLSERQVLYGHVFRNAMLIVVAGFPAAFIGAFFAGSLLIEQIFSLDGLGLLSFESIVNRDYPVVFGTLYIFSLVGLLVNLLSDLTYTWIDPRIDFETRDS
ncbi:microcin C ABC transporter permease YejB [Enterovirga sp.]|jgi:microcin C transport system permease protein|uniref:microcin C ABC transporter permease YejB n=1 Tax=Enterovirga sp. TaxID=2026350 RepID=UPI00260ED20C|nr:microcin C ABC transporter permease YejB [Enterovirga sp.]MDB5589740.1 microcin transporter permease [Enterovirga sp.]